MASTTIILLIAAINAINGVLAINTTELDMLAKVAAIYTILRLPIAILYHLTYFRPAIMTCLTCLIPLDVLIMVVGIVLGMGINT